MVLPLIYPENGLDALDILLFIYFEIAVQRYSNFQNSLPPLTYGPNVPSEFIQNI